MLHVPRRSDAQNTENTTRRLAAANRERHGLDTVRRRRRKNHGSKRPAQSNTKSGGGGGCVVLRENAAATTLGDESDARRTIDEVALASQAELPADNERDAAVREAAAIAKDVDWDVCRLCARSLALDLGQMEDHLHNIDEDERRRSHVAASVLLSSLWHGGRRTSAALVPETPLQRVSY